MALKIGIIGAGHMGRTHANILSKDKRVEIVGIVDIEESKASALGETFGASAFTKLEDLLNEVKLDALYVTTPNTRHLDPVLEGLKNDIHVFSEKPMATSLEEADKIFKQVEMASVIYQIGFNRRFAPVYKFAKSVIEKGELSPTLAHVKMNRGELQDPPWVSNEEMTGGFLYESTIHLLDMMRYLMGEVIQVECLARSNVYKQLDDFAMLLTFEGERYATFASSAHASWVFPFERIELFGEHSSLITEEMERLTYSPGLREEISIKDYSQYPTEIKWGYEEEDRRFVEAILNGESSPVSANEGYKSLQLVEACYESARTGRRVKLEI